MKKYILTVFAFTALVSCTGSFLDKNTNHENASDEMMTWDGLTTGSAFSQMTRNVIPSYQVSGDEDYGTTFYQQSEDLQGSLFAGYSGVVRSDWHYNNQYDITGAGWYEIMFTDAYTRVISPWEELDAVRDEFPGEAALGDILKVATMQRVTDTYGPVPYLQIGSGAVTMQYDSQEVVYRKFFEELGSAIDVLTGLYMAQPAVKLMESYDNVFSGQVSQWLKFANTLRLRLAMRVVYADENLAMSQAETALANPAGLLSSANDVVALHKPVSGAWVHPIYAIQYEYNDACAGATIEAYMNCYKDPRISKYFVSGSDGEFHGVRNGINLTETYRSSKLLSKANAAVFDDLVWTKPAEACFLEAEYWLRKGNDAKAKECYENGIRISFETEGASGVDSYITNATDIVDAYTDVISSSNSWQRQLTDVTVAWQSSDSFEKNLERIITQKYIAIYPAGQEAWSEFRRTGYPKVIPYSVNKSNGTIDTNLQIRRLNYPSSEYRTNNANVQAAITTLNEETLSTGKGDNGGVRLWWDRNPRF